MIRHVLIALVALALSACAALAQVTTSPSVTAVNGQTGAVIVPTLCRQQSTALAIPTANPGAVSWTFPNATCSFSAPPSCWSDISSPSTTFAFDQPLNTSRSTTAVTYSFTGHPTTLTIASLALPITLGLTTAIPSSSTVVLTCTAPPA